LTDIGTNTHAQIDTFIGTTIPATYLKLDGSNDPITGNITINTNSTTALKVEQDGVKDDVLVVDTTNGAVLVNNRFGVGATYSGALINVESSIAGGGGVYVRALRLLPTLTTAAADAYAAFLMQTQISGAFTQPAVLGAQVNNLVLAGGAVATKMAGFAIDDQTSATNNTNLLLGTTATPTGNFSLYSSSAYDSYFGGNVGIGTTGPGAKLEIQDDVSGALLKLAYKSDPSSYYQTYGAVGINNLHATTTYFHRFQLNEVDQMVIDRSGNVGIGNTNPQAKLYVSGNAMIGYTQGAPGSLTNGLAVSGNIGIGTSAPAAKLDIVGTGTDEIRLMVNTSNADSPKIHFRDGGGTDSYIYQGGNNALIFVTEDVQSGAMAISRGGNLGIGTTAPSTKLHIKETKTISALLVDGYAAAPTIEPLYSAASAQTVTRANYIDLKRPVTTNVTITDAAVMRFDAAAGTHEATVGATTKTTPGTVDAWVKININGTIYYMPAYTSTTS
jgi:hypothetical protein